MENPRCAGTYEAGNRTCDGSGDEKACAWRRYCRILRDYCNASGDDPERLANLHGRETLEALLRRVESRAGAGGFKKGIPVHVIEKEEATEPEDEGRFRHVWHLHEHFQNHMIDRFGVERFANLLHQDTVKVLVLRPGTIYPIDRVESSKYVAWMCKAVKYRDIPLAIVFLRPRSRTVNVHLPITLPVLNHRVGQSTLDKLYPQPTTGGRYRTILRGLDLERIGITVGVMKRLADLGEYDLPKYE